jgi:2-methylisocitrate lyase-like PEP mutase family enzyme
MDDHTDEKAARFLAFHQQEHPLLLANAWDVGSAKLLASLGFQALATTSSGYAASLGRLDYGISREEALAHAAALVTATDVPVSADFEDGFATDPVGVAETVRFALEVGLAGCSVEDWDPREQRLYDIDAATERVAAAAEAAHTSPVHLVLTARAENHLRGNPDLRDTIARLQAYQQAGADVLYAPALDRPQDLRELVAAVELPVNVLARPGTPPVAELAALGVKRISVGGGFAFAAYGAAVRVASELLSDGTYGFTELSAAGAKPPARCLPIERHDHLGRYTLDQRQLALMPGKGRQAGGFQCRCPRVEGSDRRSCCPASADAHAPTCSRSRSSDRRSARRWGTTPRSAGAILSPSPTRASPSRSARCPSFRWERNASDGNHVAE